MKSNSTVIQIKSLSKQYRLGTISAGTLRGDFQRWTHRIRGKEDPFLKIGDENTLNKRGSEYVWALKNIDLEIRDGDVLGIIGKNGAGKSTLLKLLSRVTGPTTGSIHVKGRIASLLEVGTGFHPELTGKENIYLNGAILGMRKSVIKSRLDEIIDFAGVSKFIDTPVKRYSSGMFVRLAFAVAAHLDPDILVVDEVLAVGDAEFQKKAIGKMQNVSQKKGRTVLFVSHNMGSIKDLCQTGLLLENGRIKIHSHINEVVSTYLSRISSGKSTSWNRTEAYNDLFSFLEISITNESGIEKGVIGTGESFAIHIVSHSSTRLSNAIIAIQINSSNGNPVLTTSNSDSNNQLETIDAGKNLYRIEMDTNILMPDTYSFIVACFEPGKKLHDIVENEISLKIEDFGLMLYNRDRRGVVCPIYQWKKE